MREVTREEMDVLIRLQANEDDKTKVQAVLNRLPEQIALLDQQMAEEEKRIKDRELSWNEQKKRYRDSEAEVKTRQESIRKSDQKLMSIKSNKEYQAVLTEIEDLKRQIAKLEDGMLKILFDLEEEEKTLARDRKDWEAEKSRFAEERRDLESQQQEEENRLAALADEWRRIAESAPRPLLNHYLEVRGRIPGGKAVAVVREYVCQGCFMNIPAQMYNELHTTNILRFCPFCNRIIYVNNRKEE
ncbi:MAG: C4-type zinc ribbon domain-containing protein [Thermodesulfobacteriota bacterium]